jgi:hypothetical protein
MTTRADNAETLAIRAAFEAFVERLNHELHALNGSELAELDGSRHAHVSLLVNSDGKTFVVATVVQFNSDPAAIEAAIQLAKGMPSA